MKYLKNIVINVLNLICKTLKIQNNKIVFESGRGNVDESPKAIYDYIKENCPNDFKTIWLIEKSTDSSQLQKGDFAYYNTLKAFYHLATTKYFIKSQSIGSIIKKKKNQVYLQTWHGIGALKKGGYQVTGEKNPKPLPHTKEWDYLLASDKYLLEHLLEATAYKGKYEIVGNPLVDKFYKKNTTEEKIKIKQKLGIKDFNKKVVLYSPTFREQYIENNNCEMKINNVAEIEDIIFVVTCHPLMRKAMNTMKLDNRIINAINYTDNVELLAIADILISDYSATIFHYSFFKKPIIYYCYDLEEYSKNRNNFIIDYKKDLVGLYAYNEQELIEQIKKAPQYEKKHQKEILEFCNKYHNLNDGKVCERIVHNIKNNKYKPY